MNSPVIRANYFSGISGLQLPIPKYQFPEEFQSFSRLQYYATFFNSIEINSSFYKMPRRITLDKWAASVGKNFRFTYKLFQDITHTKPFTLNKADIALFLGAISGSLDSLGCLLIQFPPSLKIKHINDVEHLLTHLRTLETGRDIPIAIEFRDRSWYCNPVYEMVARHSATMVIHDKASVPSPMLKITADVVYLRFHGPSGDYRGSYATDFLYEYAGYIHEWLLEGKTVYVYFNNTLGDAFTNLQMLNKLVAELE